MYQAKLALFLLAVGLTTVAQNAAPSQPQLSLTPPKPTCNPNNFFTGSDCQDRINLYNQAVRQQEILQLYVNRQKALTSAQATALLQQQTTDLTRLSNDMKKLTDDEQEQLEQLQTQMHFDSAVLQAKSAAHKQGLEQGVAIGTGAMLLLSLILAVKKLLRTHLSDDLPSETV